MGQILIPCGCCNPCPCSCHLTCDPKLPTDGAGDKGGILFGKDAVQPLSLPIAKLTPQLKCVYSQQIVEMGDMPLSTPIGEGPLNGSLSLAPYSLIFYYNPAYFGTIFS